MSTPIDPRALRAPASELQEAVRELRPHVLHSAWFSIIASLLLLMPTWYMLEVYDRVVNSRNHMTLGMLTLLVLASYVLMELLEWAHSQHMHHAGLEFDRRMRNRVFDVIFEANLKRVGPGTAQPLSDLRVLREFLGSALLKALVESPVALVFLVLIFAIHPILGVSALVGAILQTFVAWLNELGTQPPLAAAGRASIAAQQYADGSLRNAQVIESMGMLRDIHQRWIAKQREFLGLQAVASDRAGAWGAVSKFMQTVMSSLLLGLGAYLMLRNEMGASGGMLMVGSILGGRVLQPLVQIVTQWRTAVTTREAWKRLNALLVALPVRPDSMELPPPRGGLSAENLLTAAPGTQTPILKGVTFAVAPGEVVAVVGPSASGKTTLARVLTGVWPSAGGKARLDSVDVYAWDKTELGPHVGYLPQGVELFDGTIAENIARFGEVDPVKVEAAARAVGLHEFIVSLPAGYDTELGPEGARLSGGQRQRVALARALYGDPVFVVLDEPNSSLDEQGEAALASAIQQYKARGTTFIVITHRTSVLGVADKVLILKDGTVAAFGPRDEVLSALQKAAQGGAPGQPGRPQMMPVRTVQETTA